MNTPGNTPGSNVDERLRASMRRRAEDIDSVTPWRPPARSAQRARPPWLRLTQAAGAVVVTVAVVVVALVATQVRTHRREVPATPIGLTRSAPGPSPSVAVTSPPVKSPSVTAPSVTAPASHGATPKSCDVGMPASWAGSIAAGRLALPSAQNRPLSNGPDSALLVSSTAVDAAGQDISERLFVVDGAGGTTTIWRSPHPATETVLADQSAAISTGWVVFLVDRFAADGVQTGDVMAYDRSSKTTRLIGTTSNDAPPIVVGDVIYWFKSSGDPSQPPTPGTALGQNLATHHQVLQRAETQDVAFLRVGTDVVWQRGYAGPLSSPAMSIPPAVSAAFAGSPVQSDGSVLYAAQARGAALAVRRWAPGTTTVTTYPFDSARGLSGLAVAFPYLASTFGNPGEYGFLIDLRSATTVRLSGGLVLSSVNAGQAVFTRSYAQQSGPTAVYRVPLASLPAPHC